MRIDIDGTANLKPAIAEFKAFEAQVASVNAELAKSTMIPAGGSPTGYAKAAKGAKSAAAAYNAALASSGAYRVEQLRVNDAVSHNIDLLQRQKLGIRDVFGGRNKKLMQSMYREQLALQQAMTRSMMGGVSDGRTEMSLAIPTEVTKSWDNLNNRVGWFRYRLASASQQLINWGKNTQWAGRQLTAGLTMPMAAFGAAAAVMTYQVDQQLTRIAKVYDTTANQNSVNVAEQAAAEKELLEVREAGMKTAVDAARAYGAAATETLEVQAELAATGLKGLELQKATMQVQRISTLGELDQADATKALISLQTILGQNAEEVGHSFDYLNAIENATSLSTQDFAAAIPRALGPMKEMGGDLQDLSVLLVAMKERGVEAAQGANAIKAMMQRLYRPSKQVREEWMQMAKVDPLKIVEESDGDIMKILPKISDAIEGIDRPQRVKLLAGLFGTYQVTRMDAMLEGIDAMNEGLGQTTRVLEVNQQGFEKWGDIAEQELKQRTDSISGQFKIALETVKAELAEIGEPFLEIATLFLKVTEAGLHLFNQMPDWAKKLAAFLAIAAALVGPIVMLVGLFANFGGSLGKIVAVSLKWFSSLELLNKSQIAARVSAKLAETEFIREAGAANALTGRVNALTLAVNEYARAMYNAQGINLPVHLQQPVQVKPGMIPSSNMPSHPSNAVALGMPLGSTARINSAELIGSDKTAKEKVGWIRAQAEEQRKVAQQQHAINQQAMAENVIREKTEKRVNATNVGLTVMGAAMATNLIFANETADEISKWAMIGTMVVPAVIVLGKAMSNATKWAWGFAAAQAAAAKSSYQAAAATTALAGRGAAARAMIGGAAAGFTALLNPIGIATVAIGAIGIGAYKWWQHEKAITEEKEKQNRAMYEQNNLMQESLDIRERELKTLSTPTAMDIKGEITTGQLASEMEQTPEMGTLIDSIKEADTATEAATIAAKKYMDVLQSAGGSARKATQYIAALYMAAGDGALEAEKKAKELASQIGYVVNSSDMTKLYDGMITSMEGDTMDSMEQQGEAIGKLFADSLARGTNEQFESNFNQMSSIITSKWQEILAQLDNDTAKIFSDAGVKSADQMSQFINDFNNIGSEGLSADQFGEKWGIEDLYDLDSIGMAVSTAMVAAGDEINSALTAEQQIVKVLREQLGISEDITTMAELRATWEYKLQTANKDNVGWLYAQKTAAYDVLNAIAFIGGQQDENIEKKKLEVANQLLAARGLQQQETLAAALDILFGRVAGKAAKIADNLNKIPKGITVSIKTDQIGGILQDSMSGVMDDVSSNISDRFDNSMSNAIESYRNGWDSRIQGLQNAQENAMDKFDARWERRKDAVQKYYEERMKGIDDAIKAEEKAEKIRQRIFEAEQQRLERAAEAANRAIDFNVALQSGDLDEAAKIRNDMEATAADWALSDAAGAGQSRSERRIEGLNNRKDNLQDALDAKMKALEKEEDMERKHLQNVQEMRADALQAQADAAIDAYQAEWDARKENLNDQLDLFKSYIPKNMRELKVWMQQMRGEFGEFGNNTLDPMSDKWGKFFQDSFRKHMRLAGTEVASSNLWEVWGSRTATSMLKGMGFGSMAKFEQFIRTGKLPDDFGKVASDTTPMPGTGAHNPDKPHAPIQLNHGGGLIGAGGSGRKGVARTQRGIGPGERMVLARDNEFMVNEHAAKANMGLLNAINSGAITSRANKGRGIGGAVGPYGLMAAALMSGFSTGALVGIAKQVATKRASHALSSAAGFIGGGFKSGPGGLHRASVPGKGWRNSHDYGNGEFSPIYAYNDGVVVSSHATTSGGSPGNGKYTDPASGRGYTSYGEVIAIRGVDGNTVMAAHLSPGKRFAKVGQRVKGGSLIGLSGNTGNSTGFHTHFEVNGAEVAREWFASHGIGLSSGSYIAKAGMANLHDDEVVVDSKRTKILFDGIEQMQGAWKALNLSWSNPKMDSYRAFGVNDNVADEGFTQYNSVVVNVHGADLDANDVADIAVRKIEKQQNRKPQRRGK